MDFIRVVNWEKFQHYGTRRAPPWIRLYNSLIENYQWGALSDAGKAHLVGLYLLASRTGNRIPADPKWIGQRIQARSEVDLSEIAAQGFIERWTDESATPDTCQPDASIEEKREEETTGEKRRRTRAGNCQALSGEAEPTPAEVLAHGISIGYPAIDAEGFVARYRAVGWKIGQTPIRDWRALVQRWKSREKPVASGTGAVSVGRRLMLKLASEEKPSPEGGGT